MAIWGLIIAGGLVIGTIPLFRGLAVVNRNHRQAVPETIAIDPRGLAHYLRTRAHEDCKRDRNHRRVPKRIATDGGCGTGIQTTSLLPVVRSYHERLGRPGYRA